MNISNMTYVTISIEIPRGGELLYRARSSQKLSQQELANCAGVSASRISEIEREEDGRNTIPLETLSRIEKCLSKSLISPTEFIRTCIDAYEKTVSEI